MKIQFTSNLQRLFNREHFTLIELMAVIAIIAILVGILYPALRTIREGPKKARAKADMHALEVALQQFYAEYGKWPNTSGQPQPPFPANPPATWAEFSTMLNGNRNPLTGVDAAGGSWAVVNNPRGLKLMDFDKRTVSANAELLDPWGTPYRVLMDNGGYAIGGPWATWADTIWRDASNDWDLWPMYPSNMPSDGVLRRPQRKGIWANNYDVQKAIAIYSLGPNKTDNIGANPASQSDDICNWLD